MYLSFIFVLFLILFESCRTSSGLEKQVYIVRNGTEDKGAELIKGSDCFTCHANERELVGPSFISVSEKYAATEKNLKMLSKKILDGGKGHWGKVPMVPHPSLPKDDAETIVRYILLLKK